MEMEAITTIIPTIIIVSAHLQSNNIQSLQLVLNNFNKIKSIYYKYDFDQCVNEMFEKAYEHSKNIQRKNK